MGHEEAALVVAQLMCASARTAPKSKGLDTISTSIISGAQLLSVADRMDLLSKERGLAFLSRDAKNLRASSCAVLIGVESRPLGLNCGACGYERCDEVPKKVGHADFAGPCCHFKTLDLGIALASAAKTASLHNADTRIMYTVGTAARKLGLMDADIVIGIPVSFSGKNIFFDRG